MNSETAIDALILGMTQAEVRTTAGPPSKLITDPYLGDPSFSAAWLYRDTRHSGGYTYVSFDHDGRVADIRGSVGFGVLGVG